MFIRIFLIRNKKAEIRLKPIREVRFIYKWKILCKNLYLIVFQEIIRRYRRYNTVVKKKRRFFMYGIKNIDKAKVLP